MQTELENKEVYTALGMMSGTSMDGIDVAVLRTDGMAEIDILCAGEYPYDAPFRARLKHALEDAKGLTGTSERTDFLKEVELEINERHASAVNDLLCSGKISPGQIDVIGFHGQTVLHRPDRGFTVQLGDGQLLANQTGIPLVYDMRTNDMANGGQGAPLIPVYHQALAKRLALSSQLLPNSDQSALPVAFVNIGGISNITWIGKNDELIAFDTGPGNALIDQWVQSEAGIPYDQGGSIAAEGNVVQNVLHRYLDEAFFQQSVPKSLDRKDFFPLTSSKVSLEDGARTLARVTAESIVKACDHLPEPPKTWIVSGGGRKNPSILRDLKELAEKKHGSMVVVAEEYGFDGDAMEAEAWAFLAVRSIKSLPLTFPATTACHEPVSGGKLVFPKPRGTS